jgi:nitric oxide reductase NorD protein
MAEPEELITDAARHATIFARDLWRRHRPPADRPRTVTLADVAARVDLVVTAVFGAGYPLRVAQPPVPPTFLQHAFRHRRGPRHERAIPATDGVSLWLPGDLEISDAVQAASLYKTLALQQAMRAHRASAAHTLDDPTPLLADIYLLLEAYAADESLLRELPGLAASLDALRAASLAARPPLEAFSPRRRVLEVLVRLMLESRCGHPADAALMTGSPQESVIVAGQICAELAPDAAVIKEFGMDPLLKDLWTGDLHAAAPAGSSTFTDEATRDGDDDTRPSSSRLRRTPDIREATEHEDDEHDEPGVWMVQGDEPHQHAEDPMGMRRPADRDEETSAEDLADMVSDLPEARLISTPGRPREVLISDDPPHARVQRPGGAKAGDEARFQYPEWDYRFPAYRDASVTVHASTAELGSESWVDETLHAHGAVLADIRRRFEMLRAKRAWHRRQLDGEEIDIDAFIESQADFRAGAHRAETFYATRRPTERSLSIMLLIDVSGSTDGWISADRRVIDVEREALLLVCEALPGLGERYAVEAFSGQGAHGVTLRSVKRFDERYGPSVARRIAALEPEHYTRAGAAIRHASALLMREPAAHRLLLLLSDGKPNDVDEYEGRYGVEDMRQAVVEAKLQGIYPFCLTIDRQAANYLPRVFGANQYALLTQPARLPTVLLDWIKRLILA